MIKCGVTFICDNNVVVVDIETKSMPRIGEFVEVSFNHPGMVSCIRQVEITEVHHISRVINGIEFDKEVDVELVGVLVHRF